MTVASLARWWAAIPRIPGALILFWLLLAVLGPLLAPFAPGEVVSRTVFAPISAHHLLGTDYLGRDVLTRLLCGTSSTVLLCATATLLACTGGVFLGTIAALKQGVTDTLLSRFMDGVISIPSLLSALVAVAAFGSSVPVLVLAMSLIYMPGSYRTSRMLALSIVRRDFVLAARMRGEKAGYIVLREVLPNMMGPVMADVGLRFIYAVRLLSNLSFLGVGLQPPLTDLGSLTRENLLGLVYGAPAVIAPALTIAVLTVGLNLALDSNRGEPD
ncbi:ABC transporter permease [Acetobacter fallax]|uniref:ABC transporter permease subunit n=1 Tax=Acetobacter fallax TaxID=1737473 RepID=A0ABX0KA11_9PROT|nr:ABC transporter permease [Acetobacter fallax]NHO32633.1 ABC transporter permease subunit [Acetobacter fallax]NHO36169.1 ABC transporter permease subunit [Acetobacter fallax]